MNFRLFSADVGFSYAMLPAFFEKQSLEKIVIKRRFTGHTYPGRLGTLDAFSSLKFLAIRANITRDFCYYVNPALQLQIQSSRPMNLPEILHLKIEQLYLQTTRFRWTTDSKVDDYVDE
jgi:hypothetical protein